MKLIFDKDSYSMQIEGLAWTVRYKHYVLGLAPRSGNLFKKSYTVNKVWRWIGVALGFNYHTGSKGVWCWFSLVAFNGLVNIRLLSKEEYRPGY